MLNQLAREVVHHLWDEYKRTTPQMKMILELLHEHHIQDYSLDHFALIDLPSVHSGIPMMQKIFSALGFECRGNDYLPEKQNDFLWMAIKDCDKRSALQVLPQVVVADFRLNEMPNEIAEIIEHYASFATPFPHEFLEDALSKLHIPANYSLVLKKIIDYFSGREWPLPSVYEFEKVKAFNELLAWVLIFGRKPNHFTLGLHLQNQIGKFSDCVELIKTKLKISFNQEGGLIKGEEKKGILQAATRNQETIVQLADGEVKLPTGFVELVWRFPINHHKKPILFGDFYTGFIASQATQVIESLYHKVG